VSRRRALASCCALGAAAWLASCGTTLPEFPRRSPLGAIEPSGTAAVVAPVAPDRLGPSYASVQARRAVGERVADLIERDFYDPFLNGVDWIAARERAVERVAAAQDDQAVYAALKDLAAAVHDTHTVVLTPREVADGRAFVSLRTGAQLAAVDDGIAVVDVEAGSPAQRAGVRRGDAVLALDGHRLDARFFAAPPPPDPDDVRSAPAEPGEAARWRRMRAVAALLQRRPDAVPAPRTFELASADGEVRRVTLAAERSERPFHVGSGRLDDGIAWVRIDRYQAQLRPEIARALDAAAAAPALVLDLRGNGGGSFDLYRDVAGRLMPERRLALYLLRRRAPGAKQTTVTELRLGGARDALGQPLAILIDARTASAAELTAVTLAETRGALLVGQASCGCAVGVQTEYVLPDGGALRVAEIGFRSTRGRRIEGEPLAPQIVAEPTLQDIRTGRDVALDEAVRLLRARLAGAVADGRRGGTASADGVSAAGAKIP